MLFATLDTAVRRIDAPGHLPFLLSDTVGFVSDLPHMLVKAFRSTLEEACYADLLLEVVDFSDPDYQEQIAVTAKTLEEIGANHIPIVYLYNKTDLAMAERCKESDPDLALEDRRGESEPDMALEDRRGESEPDTALEDRRKVSDPDMGDQRKGAGTGSETHGREKTCEIKDSDADDRPKSTDPRPAFLKERPVPAQIPYRRGDVLYLAAGKSVGIPEILDLIDDALSGNRTECTFRVPYARAGLLQEIRSAGVLLAEEYLPEGILVRARCRREDARRFRALLGQPHKAESVQNTE